MNDELVKQIYKNLACKKVTQVTNLTEPDVADEFFAYKLIAAPYNDLLAMKKLVAHDARINFEVKGVVFDADIGSALGYCWAHEFGPGRDEVIGLHFVLQAIGFHDPAHER